MPGRPDGEHRAGHDLNLDLLDRIAGRPIRALDQQASGLRELARSVVVRVARRDERAGGIDQDRGLDVRGAVDEAPDVHRGQNSRVQLARISWIAAVAICLVAAVLLLVSGYSGYAAVLVAVGAAAAVNVV